MKSLYDSVSIKCSRLTTHTYSTSFSIGIRCLKGELRDPIHAIYGFVRFADEIVDSFHDFNKQQLLDRFKEDTERALDEKISLNPILNSFQATVNHYNIDRHHIELFLNSMEMDLDKKTYDPEKFNQYILGSAEAVGLMCLRIFCNNDHTTYDKLKAHAMSLGAAFQKINFLRDMNADFNGMGRMYFPNLTMEEFNETSKREIEASIDRDLEHAYEGIIQLPSSARLGVYVAYKYYLALFKKIKKTAPEKILESRIRIRNRHKVSLLAYSYVKHQFNLL